MLAPGEPLALRMGGAPAELNPVGLTTYARMREGLARGCAPVACPAVRSAREEAEDMVRGVVMLCGVQELPFRAGAVQPSAVLGSIGQPCV